MDSAIWELRIRLGRIAVRVTYWCRSDGTIVLLTVFRKIRQHDQGQIDRAVRAQLLCDREHVKPAGSSYERRV